MKTAESTIVGAMVAPEGKAPFDRANVVIASQTEPGELLQVRAYVGPDEVEGKPLVRDEWTSLLKSEHAIAIGPVKGAPGATFWVLRPAFEGREAALEELRTCGGLLHDTFRLADGSFGCLVSERDPAVNALRDRWAEEAFEKAMSWAKSNHWERACVAATRAFVVERAMSPERIAMLALAHERCGNVTRATGYVEMAKRSRGAGFAAQVIEKRADLERMMADGAPQSGVRPRFFEAMQAASARGLHAGRKQIHDRKKAA
ncbi:MAG: hypothetical protein ABI134_27535 [Byssovorax sp.]